jgi:hypothetical protein
MNRVITLTFFAQAAFLLAISLALPAVAHIDLLSPTPILDGKGQGGRALKSPPFGAPGVDVASAHVTEVQAGSTIELEINMYVYHPGYIIAMYTRDPAGGDMAPAMSIPSADTAIPHVNELARMDAPCLEVDGACARGRGGDQTFTLNVPLPDIEGEIILVLRQVMFDKLDPMDDGSVSLSRIYYHQAARLNLVR